MSELTHIITTDEQAVRTMLQLNARLSRNYEEQVPVLQQMLERTETKTKLTRRFLALLSGNATEATVVALAALQEEMRNQAAGDEITYAREKSLSEESIQMMRSQTLLYRHMKGLPAPLASDADYATLEASDAALRSVEGQVKQMHEKITAAGQSFTSVNAQLVARGKAMEAARVQNLLKQ